ncbi:MAG: hypothetical protein WCI06_10735 [Methylococcaceae bacterium]
MQTENLKLTNNLVLHGEKKTPAVKVQPNPAAISSNHFVLTGLTALLEKCDQDFASVVAFTNQMIVDLAIYTHAEVGAFFLWNEEAQRLELSNFYNMGASEKITAEFLIGRRFNSRRGIRKKTDFHHAYRRQSLHRENR